jgi:hypothetical protein
MEQPFYIGQKVVCINDKGIADPTMTPITKGEVYTVAHAWYVYEKWYLKFEETPYKENYAAIRFAPLPPAYENISAELAKDSTPETSDIIIKPIPVTN